MPCRWLDRLAMLSTQKGRLKSRQPILLLRPIQSQESAQPQLSAIPTSVPPSDQPLGRRRKSNRDSHQSSPRLTTSSSSLNTTRCPGQGSSSFLVCTPIRKTLNPPRDCCQISRALLIPLPALRNAPNKVLPSPHLPSSQLGQCFPPISKNRTHDSRLCSTPRSPPRSRSGHPA